MRIGAHTLGEGRCEFTVWAPREKQLSVKILDGRRPLPLKPVEGGYWQAVAEGAPPGTRYLICLENGRELPDPASFFQPEGVHKPSQVVDHGAFSWSDSGWNSPPLENFVIYELHVGTFTPEGTFDAVIPRLPELRDLGITAIELMPVSQFPGRRGWGYDGVHPFAPQNTYGGPEGLKRLVDACHGAGLAVVLDVVYNHMGPEGNYLHDFGPYFTAKYRTPWGDAINMDDDGSDEVRDYFIESALHWFRHYHFDALRLDATDRIYDFSAKPFLQELNERVNELERSSGRTFLLIAESDLNDVRLLRPPEHGGFGLDAQWNDDFHHALHALLTGEDLGYYEDFGRPSDLAKAYREGFIYDWRYSPYRGHRRGSSSADLPGRQLVIFSQNHDQIGNRMFGARLLRLTSFEEAKVAAAAVLLAPFVPLLFMGEEFAEEAPFQYFADFLDPHLREAVHQGRIQEFSAFKWRGEPPDPHDPETFERSRLNWERRNEGAHGVMLSWYRRLLQLRREVPALVRPEKKNLEAGSLEDERIVWLHRWRNGSQILLLLNFNKDPVSFPLPVEGGSWRRLLDSADVQWQGPGTDLPEVIESGTTVAMAGRSCALLVKEPG